MVKTRPIVLNPYDVRAILNGDKTSMRLLIQPNLTFGTPWSPEDWEMDPDFLESNGKQVAVFHRRGDYGKCSAEFPYGKAGDRLWVKERWCRGPKWDGHGKVIGEEIKYAASCGTRGHTVEFKWESASRMPKKHSRILLEITDIKVKRLLDITEEEAKKEGFNPTYHRELDYVEMSAKSKFLDQFKANNCTAGNNPWVWVVEFKRI